MEIRLLAVVLLSMLSHRALATMPTLTSMPKAASPGACEKWAGRQNADAIEMWGIQENGRSSREEALRRLTLSCRGKASPEIVGFGSSVGFDEMYCRKHPEVEICKTYIRAQAPQNVQGCFIRNYDQVHLAKHPNQLVTNVGLLIRDAKGNTPPYKYTFVLQVRTRGRSQVMQTEGLCKEGEASSLRCSVECDGGAINVSVRPSYLMMHLDRIRMAACGKDMHGLDAEELSGGIDDREFRIDRADNALCSQYAVGLPTKVSAAVLGPQGSGGQEIGQPGSFPLASCKGWSATLTELKGKGTDHAVMKGVLTTSDAKEYCERDPGGITVAYGGKMSVADCIANVLSDARSTNPPTTEVSATADCRRGVIVAATEKLYQAIKVDGTSADPEITWKHVKSGTILGQSCGDGTPPVTAQFKIMCPGRLVPRN
jgi:hypothetical protein